MTRAEEILLKELRYIASISNGQVKRVADSALASVSEYLATEPKPTLKEALAQQVAVPQKCKQIHVTEAMHRAAVKVLHRAPGVAGLPQRMMDAMLAAQGEKP